MTMPPAPSHPIDEPPPAPPRTRLSRRWWYLLPAALLIAAAWYLLSGRGGPSSQKEGRRAALPAPVLALPAGRGDIGIYLNGLGTVIPLNTVTVKSRIDGELMEVLFREGETVRQGQLLAVIDPRPFEVELTQAEGQMARDTALLRNARLDLERYRLLWAQDSIPKQQLDTQESLVRQLEGAVKIDQGQIDAARLQLTYSRITAPVTGRVGLRQVDPGNIVHTTDTNGVVVITQMQPMSVLFPIPEGSLPPVLAKLKKGERLPVAALDREQRGVLAMGQLLTVDNQIDPTTGTVRLKAVFPNTGNELFPNQFVNARLLLETRRGAILVPSAAIQSGPRGSFVYVVRRDRSVTVRPVAVGVVQDDRSAIESGVAQGELVVVEGAERLREGSRVELRPPATVNHGAPGAGGKGEGEPGLSPEAKGAGRPGDGGPAAPPSGPRR